MNLTVRSIIAPATAAVCLWPVAAAAQDVPSGLGSILTLEQVRGGFASAGYQVDDAVRWDWTSPPVSTVRIRDAATDRVVIALVYPTGEAASAARFRARTAEQKQLPGGAITGNRGPHIVIGYGESVWLSNVGLVQTTQSHLNHVYQVEIECDNGGYVSQEPVAQATERGWTVDVDFMQALNASVVNL